MKRTASNSFLKIVLYTSNTYEDLNQSEPTYRGKKVDVIGVETIATDSSGIPLFCYELVLL